MTQPDVPAFDAFSTLCPSQTVLRDLTGPWVPLVLVSIDDGATRFGEIHRRVGGSSERMIAQTLRKLEDDGFVLRSTEGARPTYTLTRGGHTVATRFRDLLADLYRHLESEQSRDPVGQGPTIS